jgi:hypothetical protein
VAANTSNERFLLKGMSDLEKLFTDRWYTTPRLRERSGFQMDANDAIVTRRVGRDSCGKCRASRCPEAKEPRISKASEELMDAGRFDIAV